MERIAILDGNNFLVSDGLGDISSNPDGLYYRDTRFLSCFTLMLDGQAPRLLTSRRVDYYSAQYALTNPDLKPDCPFGALSIQRTRLVGDGFCEDQEIESHLPQVIRFQLSLELAADFLDLFEVKALEFPDRDHVFCGPCGPKLVRRDEDPDRGWLAFVYAQDDFSARTVLAFSVPFVLSDTGVTFPVELRPGESWKLHIRCSLVHGNDGRRPLYTARDCGAEPAQGGGGLAHLEPSGAAAFDRLG